MQYTEEQLNADIGTIIKDNILDADLLDVLSWKKWRVMENKTVKAGHKDKVEYSVSEIGAIPHKTTYWNLFVFLVSGFNYQMPVPNKLQWQRCGKRYYGVSGDIVKKPYTFKTKEEAEAFVCHLISFNTKSVTTQKVISIQPE